MSTAAITPKPATTITSQEREDNIRKWERACREIIDRCVAPDMYRNACEMLDRAVAEALRTLP